MQSMFGVHSSSNKDESLPSPKWKGAGVSDLPLGGWPFSLTYVVNCSLQFPAELFLSSCWINFGEREPKFRDPFIASVFATMAIF